MTYAYYDHHDLMLEMRELEHARVMKMTEMVCELKPDCFQTVGSGGLALQSPALFRELGLPTLKALTKMCKEAGVLTMVHCCGPEYQMVKMAAEESDLNGINPLEIPPMGDCNLAQLKREFGHKLCLMGNLHTVEVMFRGTPDENMFRLVEVARTYGKY